MKMLDTWHGRIYAKISFEDKESFPHNTCDYIVGWAVNILLYLIVSMIIGFVTGLYIYCVQIIINNDLMNTTYEPSFVVIVTILFILWILIRIVNSEMYKKLRQKYCKPINWKE